MTILNNGTYKCDECGRFIGHKAFAEGRAGCFITTVQDHLGGMDEHHEAWCCSKHAPSYVELPEHNQKEE